jgi:hypothetical protein
MKYGGIILRKQVVAGLKGKTNPLGVIFMP